MYATNYDTYYTRINKLVLCYPDFNSLITYTENVLYGKEHLIMCDNSIIIITRVPDKLFNYVEIYFDYLIGNIEIESLNLKNIKLTTTNKLSYSIFFDSYDTSFIIKITDGICKISKLKFKYIET